MGKIILVCVESSCLELLSKQCSVLMLPAPHRVPVPSSGMAVGRAVHRLSLQSSPPLWPAGHTTPKDREGQGEDMSSHDALVCRKIDGVSG